jgi:hypothetical protein
MMLFSILLWLAVPDPQTAKLLEEVKRSGRVVELATAPSDRLAPPPALAPGPPPLVGFRLLEGRLRHRFGDLDLMLDDAGH